MKNKLWRKLQKFLAVQLDVPAESFKFDTKLTEVFSVLPSDRDIVLRHLEKVFGLELTYSDVFEKSQTLEDLVQVLVDASSKSHVKLGRREKLYYISYRDKEGEFCEKQITARNHNEAVQQILQTGAVEIIGLERVDDSHEEEYIDRPNLTRRTHGLVRAILLALLVGGAIAAWFWWKHL